MKDENLVSSYLYDTIWSGRSPPGYLETVCLDREDLDITGTGWSPFIRHDDHNGVWTFSLWIGHSDGDEVLGVDRQVGQGVAGGCRVVHSHLLGLLGARVSGPEDRAGVIKLFSFGWLNELSMIMYKV